MTQEEKARAYDKAIERANELYDEHERDIALLIFPELKESKDERIRKELIKYFTKGKEYLSLIPYSKDECIAWLEKQGEKKEEVTVIGNGSNSVSVSDGNTSVTSKKVVSQPTAYSTIEPKFKVGDWVIDKQDIVHQIANVIENVTYHTYGYDIVDGGYFNDNTEGVRLWTIQDAKAGDVLVSRFNQPFIYNGKCNNYTVGAYCGVDSEGTGVFGSGRGTGWTVVEGVTPATKEKREILFAKIKEAGFKWDAKKKELKKISQRMISAEAKEAILEQKPVWSEEDEKMFNTALDMIEWYSGKNESKSRAVSDWLKSLRPQSHWKPSEEQMEALKDATDKQWDIDGDALWHLYQDLKKLIG